MNAATEERMDGYLSPSRAAARLGISEGALRGWAQRGRIAATRSPLGRLYRTEDMERAALERAGKEAK